VFEGRDSPNALEAVRKKNLLPGSMGPAMVSVTDSPFVKASITFTAGHCDLGMLADVLECNTK